MTRLRALLLGVLALTLAFTSAACSGSKHAAKPATQPSATPSYYAAGVPYVVDQTLYIDHVATPGRWIRSETASGYTAAQRWDDRADVTLVIMDSRTGRPVLTAPHLISGPTFSSNGRKLAWVTTVGENKGSLVVQDLDSFRTLGRLAIPVLPNGAEGISVGLDVTNDGTAFYELRGKGWSWKPGGAPARVATPGGTEFVNPVGFAGVREAVRLSPDHLWGAWLNREGDLVAQHPGDPSSRVVLKREPNTGKRGLVEWNSPTTPWIDSLETTADGQPVLLSCDFGTGLCDVATSSP